jgi:hypothetical protein
MKAMKALGSILKIYEHTHFASVFSLVSQSHGRSSILLTIPWKKFHCEENFNPPKDTLRFT